MKTVTNNHGVPLALAVWALHDEYDYVDKPNYYSVTTLMKPLRHIVLPHRVPEDLQISEDVIDYLARASGTAYHSAVENAWHRGFGRSLARLGYPQSVIDRVVINPEQLQPGQIPVYMEQREYRELSIDGVIYTIGGKFDMVAEGIVHDIKSTSVYTWIKGARKDEHKLQGSLYRLLNPGKITADFIRICYIFKDWSKAMAKTDPKYPQQPMVSIDIPLMSIQETEAWVRTKLMAIKTYWSAPEASVPFCEDADLWIDPPKFKYFSNPANTSGRSTKNFDDAASANAHCAAAGKGVIVTVLGTPKRCGFCSAYPVCTQPNKAIL